MCGCLNVRQIFVIRKIENLYRVIIVSVSLSQSIFKNVVRFLFLEISCYQCSSNTSFDECIGKQAIVDCLIPVHHCIKMGNKTTTNEGKVQTTYHKGCATRDQCKQTSTATLELECCSDGKCNTGKTKCVSVACYRATDNVCSKNNLIMVLMEPKD